MGAVVWAGAVLTASSSALAQADTDALRRDLVAQAERAREAGDHQHAAELAGRAAALRMSPSLALLLAQEHEQLGHLVTALDHARRCITDATSDPALRNRDRLLGICHELTEVLSPRVGSVPVRVPPDLAHRTVPAGDRGLRRPLGYFHGLTVGLAGRVGRVTVPGPSDLGDATVRVGDRELASAAWGAAVPVDPGEVVVRVSDEALHYTQTLTVHVAVGGSVEVEVPSPRPRVEVASAPATPPLSAPTQPTAVPVEAPARGGLGAGPRVPAGVGAAPCVGAGVLWGVHGGGIGGG